MNDLASRIRATKLNDQQLGIFWLGQAGFVLKTSQGKTIAIDPYLSDCCSRLLREYGYGFKRLMPSLISEQSISFDYLLISHDHPDHLDIDSIFNLCNNTITSVFTTPTSKSKAVDLGVNDCKITAVKPGEKFENNDFNLSILDADHGELCQDAIGFFLDFGFCAVYFSGDTSYNPTIVNHVKDLNPEIAILPINGAFGNLNALEAGKFAAETGSKFMIPCHFWTFPNHGGDPAAIISELPKIAPYCNLMMLTQGEMFLYSGEDN